MVKPGKRTKSEWRRIYKRLLVLILPDSDGLPVVHNLGNQKRYATDLEAYLWLEAFGEWAPEPESLGRGRR